MEKMQVSLSLMDKNAQMTQVIDPHFKIMIYVVIGSPVIYLLDQLLKRIFMKLLHHRGERQHHQVATAGGFLENALMNMFLIIESGSVQMGTLFHRLNASYRK